MIIKVIEGMTRILGKSQGYLGLPIVDMKTDDGTEFMVSAWEPTPEELEILNRGGAVYLYVHGTVHPPVSLSVGAPKTAEQDNETS